MHIFEHRRDTAYSPDYLAAKRKTGLAVNTPGDVYEREADHLADHVMSMTKPQVQRTCPCGGGCSKCGQMSDQLQAKSVQANNPVATPAPSPVHEALRSPGQPLDPGVRDFMESRLGQDFGEVRVHADAQAAESARAVNARAYTLKRDIVFGAGQYRPESVEGKRLLAHELVHVAQQRAAGEEESGTEVIRRASPEAGEEDKWVLPDVATRQAQVDAIVPPGMSQHCTVDAAPRLEPIGGKLHIDIGGEGRYSNAYNLNPSSKGTVSPWAGKDIPHHVCGVGENIPVPSGTVDYLTLESTPMERKTVSEIARVIKPSGNIRLVSPVSPENYRWHTQVGIATGLPFELPRQVEIKGLPVYVTRIGNNFESLPLVVE